MYGSRYADVVCFKQVALPNGFTEEQLCVYSRVPENGLFLTSQIRRQVCFCVMSKSNMVAKRMLKAWFKEYQLASWGTTPITEPENKGYLVLRRDRYKKRTSNVIAGFHAPVDGVALDSARVHVRSLAVRRLRTALDAFRGWNRGMRSRKIIKWASEYLSVFRGSICSIWRPTWPDAARLSFEGGTNIIAREGGGGNIT